MSRTRRQYGVKLHLKRRWSTRFWTDEFIVLMLKAHENYGLPNFSNKASTHLYYPAPPPRTPHRPLRVERTFRNWRPLSSQQAQQADCIEEKTRLFILIAPFLTFTAPMCCEIQDGNAKLVCQAPAVYLHGNCTPRPASKKVLSQNTKEKRRQNQGSFQYRVYCLIQANVYVYFTSHNKAIRYTQSYIYMLLLLETIYR